MTGATLPAQLPSIARLLSADAEALPSGPQRAQSEWRAAIAALGELLGERGTVLSGPSPALPDVPAGWSEVVFGSDRTAPRLPGAAAGESHLQHVALSPQDPLQFEQFCIAVSPSFCLALSLAPTACGLTFQFSFDPDLVRQAIAGLQGRTTVPLPADPLPPADYRLVQRFTRHLLDAMPAVPAPTDTELLRALAHEIRTPLTTIRTLTRLVLKRDTLDGKTAERLHAIDRECSAQIDRMELIFRATETEARHPQLGPVALDRVLQQSVSCWQQAARRRDLDLDVSLPESLPVVVSDPALLNRVLNGLLECFTAGLPAGGRVQVRIATAGDCLKLQVRSPRQASKPRAGKALGQVLLVCPETGALTLNPEVTRNLFQAIGGKLTVRQRPEAGEVLTAFLPLDVTGGKSGHPPVAS